jgi:hypothetical protein
MKRFDDLHAHDQIELKLALLELLLDSGHRKIEDVAKDRDSTPRELWRTICADAGFDDCEPWPEFPDLPKKMQTAPGDDRPLPEGPALDALRELTGRKN